MGLGLGCGKGRVGLRVGVGEEERLCVHNFMQGRCREPFVGRDEDFYRHW